MNISSSNTLICNALNYKAPDCRIQKISHGKMPRNSSFLICQNTNEGETKFECFYYKDRQIFECFLCAFLWKQR